MSDPVDVWLSSRADAAGLRAGELVGVTLGGIETGARGERGLHLTGKGAKAGKVVLPPLARFALDQYLMQRGLPVSPASWTRDTPLLGHLDEPGGITTQRLSEVLRRFFRTAADAIEADHPPLAGKLRRATLTSVRDNLRHASIYLDDDEVMRTWQIERIFARRTPA